MIDFHSHILPGIDDGADNETESLALLETLSNLGFKEVVLTPHYIVESKQSSTRAKNTKIFTDLQNLAKSNGLSIKLHLANEVYVDYGILKLIKAGKVATIGSKQYILVELPMSGEFEGYEDIFLQLQQNGHTVILAHPERYSTAQKDYNILRNLHEMGVLFQCNIGSISGQYGRRAKKTIKKLIKDNYVYCFGSDIHRVTQVEHHKKGLKKLQKIYSAEEFNEKLVANPRAVLK